MNFCFFDLPGTPDISGTSKFKLWSHILPLRVTLGKNVTNSV